MHVPVGLSLANARRAYRRRMAGAMLLGVASFGLFVGLTRGPLVYDFRAMSFATASGIVERCDFDCEGPLDVKYHDNHSVDQYVDIARDDCCYHVGQTVTVIYDATGECADVELGYGDRTSGIVGDIVVLALVPIVVCAIAGWHSRRWRRRAERAAQAPVASDWYAVRTRSRTRRPIFRVIPEHSETFHVGQRHELVMTGLRRQLASGLDENTHLDVLGTPEQGGVVALCAPDSALVIWPAGRLRSGWLQIDRYDLARITSYVVPPLAGAIWHALLAQGSC